MNCKNTAVIVITFRMNIGVLMFDSIKRLMYQVACDLLKKDTGGSMQCLSLTRRLATLPQLPLVHDRCNERLSRVPRTILREIKGQFIST